MDWGQWNLGSKNDPRLVEDGLVCLACLIFMISFQCSCFTTIPVIAQDMWWAVGWINWK